jgi:phage-related protein
VKGVAKATADPVKKMAVSWSEVNEKIGGLLLPTVSKFADKVISFIPKIQAWIDKHPALIKYVAAASVGLLALGAIGKVVAFTMSGVATVINVTSTAMKFMGSTMKFVGRIFLTNPIGLIITAIAIAAYLIINNWSKIKQFFSKLWGWVKNIFSSAWSGIKNLLLNYTPHGLIIKHWSKIVSVFSNIWGGVKKTFTGWIDWVFGLGAKFVQAGKNIVSSIWKGIKAMAMKPVEAIANMVKKIRNFLPFSPAKEGALKDIHRIKLVETIASTISAKPLLNAMKNVTGQVYGHLNRPVPALAGAAAGGGMQMSLTVHLNGGASQQDAVRIADEAEKRMDRWWREKQHQQNRVGF